jgi:hypothetical protein
VILVRVVERHAQDFSVAFRRSHPLGPVSGADAPAQGRATTTVSQNRSRESEAEHEDAICYNVDEINLTQESFVDEPNREVEQAVSALTTEIIKLSPMQGEELAALSVTIENAFTRLALAILAQSNQTQEEALEEAIEEALPAAAAA